VHFGKASNTWLLASVALYLAGAYRAQRATSRNCLPLGRIPSAAAPAACGMVPGPSFSATNQKLVQIQNALLSNMKWDSNTYLDHKT
jgi:hypothetical protein